MKDKLDISNLEGDIVFAQRNNDPGESIYAIEVDGSNMKELLNLSIPISNPR